MAYELDTDNEILQLSLIEDNFGGKWKDTFPIQADCLDLQN